MPLVVAVKVTVELPAVKRAPEPVSQLPPTLMLSDVADEEMYRAFACSSSVPS